MEYTGSDLTKQMDMERFFNWCFAKHAESNHFYADYLPYRFHLEMVITEIDNHLGDKDFDCVSNGIIVTNRQIKMGGAGHDLLERFPELYHAIVNESGDKHVAEIIFACTNEKGRNRKERNSDRFYETLRHTAGANVVKYCDRIANVKFSILMNSNKKYKMYKDDNEEFIAKTYTEDLAPYGLKETLLSLFE